MPELSVILAGFADVFTLTNLMYIVLGVAVGQLAGAIPGLSILMALAIAIPLTFTLDTLTAVAFLISVNKGGTVGGAIPAILLNTPGTPESAATALDGHPMARKGYGGKAMKYSLYYSVFGDISSDIVLITVSAPLALVALKMGPIEVTFLMMLAFTVIVGLVGESMIKGLISVALGFLLASVGIDPAMGSARFTFGSVEMLDGLPLTALTIGMLAVSEIFIRLSERGAQSGQDVVGAALTFRDKGSQRLTLRELLANRYVAFRAFLIGTVIGAIPGLGSTTAGFLSYSITKQSAKDPEKLGTGDPRGIAASEAANSSVVGANMIPLLTLGIPGNIAAALLVSAFIIHGVQPGPLLFQQQGQLIYGLFGAMLIANFCNLAVGQFGMRLWARVVSAPASVVYPGALLMCATGMYFATGGTLGIVIMIVASVFGYAMRVFGYSIIAFIVAFVLTPMLERSINQTILLTNGEWSELLNHPIALALFALSIVSILYLGPRRRAKGDRRDPPDRGAAPARDEA
ncbi:tripartite tricarboxylate transporter permease [Psychromarinibacter sp. C21-152]|uniref:Tripartite tricarboxylate transporter permease n=1 Tax=Psychromarinibacter sediminicola TaxID=3033385 RepID=A0AAE3T9D6_9RHOB|nr:tripartite tricarboxylate transporter permease [Psychromarinibacter sediminicola]MDF0600445.1 tripartite tricarboxylate transporter permease [Psychromarinibacter sediminicola]